jgi:hypothetical protein
MEERTVKMNQLEINRQRAQLLTTARNLLNEEYQRQRSEQYTKWQSESNHLWISQGIMLPYPSSFGYPTEEEVVARALELYNVQNNKQSASIELPKTDESMTSSVTAKLIEVSHSVRPVVLPEVPEVTPWQQYLTPGALAETIQAPVVEEPVVEEIPLPKPVEEPEPVIEDVTVKDEPELTEEQRIEEEKSNSRLRSLLAQFITMAKSLDAKAQKDEGTAI